MKLISITDCKGNWGGCKWLSWGGEGGGVRFVLGLGEVCSDSAFVPVQLSELINKPRARGSLLGTPALGYWMMLTFPKRLCPH